MQLELVPHKDLVFADSGPDTTQVITHSMTLRRQVLPSDGAPWSLCVDESGFGALVGAEDEIICLEDFLSRALFKAPDGEYFVCKRDSAGNLGDAPWSLSNKMRER